MEDQQQQQQPFLLLKNPGHPTPEEDEEPEEWMSTDGGGSPSPNSITNSSASTTVSLITPKTSDLTTTKTTTSTIHSTDSSFSPPSTMTTLLLDTTMELDNSDDTASEEYVDAEEELVVNDKNITDNTNSISGPLIDPATFLLETLFRQILLVNRQSLSFLIGLRGVSRTWASLVLAALNSQLSLTLFAPGGADSLKAYVRSLVAVNLLGDPFYRLSETECEELLGRRPPKRSSKRISGSSRRYRSVSGGVVVNKTGGSINILDPGPSTSSSFPSSSTNSSPKTPSTPTPYPSHLPTVLANLQKLIVTKGNAENLDLAALLNDTNWSTSLQSLVVFRPPDGLAWCPVMANLGALTRLELFDLHRCSVDVAVLEPLLSQLEHLVLSWRHPHLLETAFLRAVLRALIPGRLKHLGLLTNLAVREDDGQQEEEFEAYFPSYSTDQGPRVSPPKVQGPRPVTRFEALFEQWPHGRALISSLTGLHLGDVHLELLGRVVAAAPQLEHLNFVADWKQNLHSIFDTLRGLPRLSSLSLYYANYFMADARPVVVDPEAAVNPGNAGGGHLQGPPFAGNHGHHYHHNHHHFHHYQNNPNPVIHPQHLQQHYGSNSSLNSTGKSSAIPPVLPALKSLTFRCQNLLDMGEGLPALLTSMAPACAQYHLLDNSWNEMLPAAKRFAGLFQKARAAQLAAQSATSSEIGSFKGGVSAGQRYSSSTTPSPPAPLIQQTIHWAEDFRAFYPRRLWPRLPERCQEALCLQFICSQAVHNRRSWVCKARECAACRVAAAQQNRTGGDYRALAHRHHHNLLAGTVHLRRQQQPQLNPQDPQEDVGDHQQN